MQNSIYFNIAWIHNILNQEFDMKTSSTKPFQSHNLFELLLLYAVTKNEEYFGLSMQTTRGLETSNLNIKRNILKQVLDLLHLQIQSLFLV